MEVFIVSGIFYKEKKYYDFCNYAGMLNIFISGKKMFLAKYRRGKNAKYRRGKNTKYRNRLQPKIGLEVNNDENSPNRITLHVLTFF